VRFKHAFAFAPVAIALLAGPVAARADTVVGQTASPTTACTPGTLYQARTGVAPDYTTPAGVITRWTVQTDANVAPIKLKVLHSLGGGQYQVVAESAAVTPTASSTQTFASRLPVGAGDYLAVSVLSGSADCRFSTANYDDAVREGSTADPPVGSTVTEPTSFPDSRLDVSAVVEPDRDGDGFGDTTQDACPTDPTTQSLCTADLSIHGVAIFNSLRVGKPITWSVTVHNHSPYNFSLARLTWVLPSWVRIDSITPSSGGGSCRHFHSLSRNRNIAVCTRSFPAGGAVNFLIRSTPLAGGLIRAHGSLSGESAIDPNRSNNRITVKRFIYGTAAPACANVIDGGPSGDQLVGSKAGDVIRGFGGDDYINGRGGDDCLYGGPGNDLIIGGPGHDHIYGGAGDDVIYANDGQRDWIRCGSGYDKVYADPIDVVARDCEEVIR